MERYKGTVTRAANAKSIRLDAEFFRAHPEFNGKVDVTVIANGQVLVSAKGAKQQSSEDDPVVLGFLRFLQKQMADYPESIERVDRAQFARIGKLVKGVDTE